MATIQLYEFEGCPFCKKVREEACVLDLNVVFYPCPANGPIYREKAKEMGGKSQFPLMVDPNTSKMMYESDDIIEYMYVIVLHYPKYIVLKRMNILAAV